MFGFLKPLFSMPKIIDAAIASGDALVFTDQERKAWVIEAAKVLGPQTIARRILTIIIAALWMVLTLTGVVLIILEHSQAAAFGELYTRVCLIFGIVVGFYYGAHLKRA